VLGFRKPRDIGPGIFKRGRVRAHGASGSDHRMLASTRDRPLAAAAQIDVLVAVDLVHVFPDLGKAETGDQRERRRVVR
jgi:hypothetical protein